MSYLQLYFKILEPINRFVLLEEEAKSVFEDEEEMKKGRNALENLKQFMYTDTHAVPQVLVSL